MIRQFYKWLARHQHATTKSHALKKRFVNGVEIQSRLKILNLEKYRNPVELNPKHNLNIQTAILNNPYHPDLDLKQRHQEDYFHYFLERIKKLSAEVQHAPFLEKGLKLDDDVVHYVYKHLAHKMYYGNELYFCDDSVRFLSNLQRIIKMGLSKVHYEMEVLQKEFDIDSFLSCCHRVLVANGLAFEIGDWQSLSRAFNQFSHPLTQEAIVNPNFLN